MPLQASPISRRRVLQVTGHLLACIASNSACETSRPYNGPDLAGDPIDIGVDGLDPYPGEDNGAAAQNIRALIDVLLPTERDEAGQVTSAGALDAGAYEVLRLQNFVSAARSQALLPQLPEAIFGGLERFDDAFQAIVSLDLDILANDISPLSAFRNLSRPQQRQAVINGLDDPLRSPLILFVRAACFIAYLGAVQSDAGLQVLGFPPFEDFSDGLANSGYPRTRGGRLIDAQTEDLGALADAGELDDYTYNKAPLPTEGDDLSLILNEAGDFY